MGRIILLFIICLFLIPVVVAEEIKTIPAEGNIGVEIGTNYTGEFSVVNNMNKSLDLEVLVNTQMSDSMAVPWFAFDNNGKSIRIKIEPNDKEKIYYNVIVPDDAETGHYKILIEIYSADSNTTYYSTYIYTYNSSSWFKMRAEHVYILASIIAGFLILCIFLTYFGIRRGKR